MKIQNLSKNLTLTEDAQYRDSFWGRFRGLMLSGKKDIILASKTDSIPESTIHMMNMLYPIDVVWVKDDMTVADVKKDVPAFSILKPKTWKIYGPKEPAKYVIELGRTKLKDCEIGDEIEFAK